MKDTEKLDLLKRLNYNLECTNWLLQENFNKLLEILSNVKNIDKNKEI